GVHMSVIGAGDGPSQVDSTQAPDETHDTAPAETHDGATEAAPEAPAGADDDAWRMHEAGSVQASTLEQQVQGTAGASAGAVQEAQPSMLDRAGSWLSDRAQDVSSAASSVRESATQLEGQVAQGV